jgi:thiamine monophosphate synthase
MWTAASARVDVLAVLLRMLTRVHVHSIGIDPRQGAGEVRNTEDVYDDFVNSLSGGQFLIARDMRDDLDEAYELLRRAREMLRQEAPLIINEDIDQFLSDRAALAALSQSPTEKKT